jgi:hypothetical protein
MVVTIAQLHLQEDLNVLVFRILQQRIILQVEEAAFLVLGPQKWAQVGHLKTKGDQESVPAIWHRRPRGYGQGSSG